MKRQKTIGGMSIQFKELTVREVRDWMAAGSNAGNPMDGLFSDLSLADLPAMTNLSPDGINLLTPSQIEAVIAEALKVNQALFSDMERAPRTHSPGNNRSRTHHLESTVASLIRCCGHANAWDYTWSMFKAAVEEAEAGAKR